MNRYYGDTEFVSGICETGKTRVPRNILQNHDVDEFVGLCRDRFGPVVAKQAMALLGEHAACEQQNTNALFRLSGLAQEREEWDFALELGSYFDEMGY